MTRGSTRRVISTYVRGSGVEMCDGSSTVGGDVRGEAIGDEDRVGVF